MDIQVINSMSFLGYITITKEETETLIHMPSDSIGKYIKCRDFSMPEIVTYLMGLKVTEFPRKVVDINVCNSTIKYSTLKRLKHLLPFFYL